MLMLTASTMPISPTSSETAPTTIPGILAMIEVFLDEDNEDDPRFLLKSIAAVLKPLAPSA